MERPAPHLDYKLDARPGEEWREIVGYDGYYSVSTHGRVKSKARIVKTKRGEGFFVKKGRVLKQCGASGRYQVTLCIESINSNRAVPTLVADAFLRKRMIDEVIMHSNRIPSDNNLTNLKIVTKSELTRHNYKKGEMYLTLPIIREKYKLSVYGVYKDNQLIGRICKHCQEEKKLSDFYKDMLFCKDCHGRKQGISEEKIGVNRNLAQLRKNGLQPCHKCKQIKHFDQYRKDKHRISGIASVCKSCKSSFEKVQRLSLREQTK